VAGLSPAPIERDRSTHLPFDSADLEIEFDGREFIPTGRFAFGSRSKIQELVVSRGGVFENKMPTLSTSYLVVGEFVSRDWVTTQYGRKIERAIELRDKHDSPAIVCERHFLSRCGL
jgi:NAD-dependent DNA ligase